MGKRISREGEKSFENRLPLLSTTTVAPPESREAASSSFSSPFDPAQPPSHLPQSIDCAEASKRFSSPAILGGHDDIDEAAATGGQELSSLFPSFFASLLRLSEVQSTQDKPCRRGGASRQQLVAGHGGERWMMSPAGGSEASHDTDEPAKAGEEPPALQTLAMAVLDAVWSLFGQSLRLLTSAGQSNDGKEGSGTGGRSWERMGTDSEVGLWTRHTVSSSSIRSGATTGNSAAFGFPSVERQRRKM